MTISAVEKYDGEKWHAVAGAVKPEVRLFIDGDYVDAIEGGRFESVNPTTGEVIAEVAAGTAADVDSAVASALRAYRSGSWARMAPRERMEVLYRLAELIDESVSGWVAFEDSLRVTPAAVRILGEYEGEPFGCVFVGAALR